MLATLLPPEYLTFNNNDQNALNEAAAPLPPRLRGVGARLRPRQEEGGYAEASPPDLRRGDQPVHGLAGRRPRVPLRRGRRRAQVVPDWRMMIRRPSRNQRRIRSNIPEIPLAGTVPRHSSRGHSTGTSTNKVRSDTRVLKYMYSAKCDRAEATGNVDAKLNNAMDWEIRFLNSPPSIEQNGKPKVDYTRLDKKQAALTAIWALGITPLGINVILSTVDQFVNNPGPSVIKGL
ncbi:hypothetical protein THAOC_35501 [Thalassiosira oceanica]|uniref:Uncharacterized protein n=2 Tax=Thalassiosira oceanica TaxID=159749 RepID=K0R397_THAOC|nr:hypothetical protein THAOC_35501 [Thalassiosira oceanica]|eukprot:EJK45864.1 hypothetical protein THAOC_35501 [Thalassiosira oceanica]